MDAIRNNPALIVGIVRAVLVLLVAFHLSINDSQQTAILDLVGIVVAAIVPSFVTRSLVVPNAKLKAAGIDPDTLTQAPQG